jgi:hypothetical protein
MRSIFLFMTALFLGSFVVAAAPGVAGAGPLPALSAAPTAPGIVEAVDYTRRYWRRYCKVNNCDPDDMIGQPMVTPRVVGEAIVTPDGGTVLVVPLRPSSCGQYHYWNGVACVDARYNTPNLGRKY